MENNLKLGTIVQWKLSDDTTFSKKLYGKIMRESYYVDGTAYVNVLMLNPRYDNHGTIITKAGTIINKYLGNVKIVSEEEAMLGMLEQ